MRSLYDITGDLLELEQLLTDLDGEFPEGAEGEALEAYFNGVNAESKEKLDAYAALIKHLEYRSKARKEEKARMEALRKADESAVRRLKDRLFNFFTVFKITDAIDTARFKIVIQKNGGVAPLVVEPAVLENPRDMLPKRFQKIEVDESALREALESDDPKIVKLASKYAKIGERGKSIRIR